MSISEHLMDLSLQCFPEIRNYLWDDSVFLSLLLQSSIAAKLSEYQHKAWKQEHSKCSRNCLNTWTVQERTSEQTDVSEKNKQKKQSKTLHYIIFHVMKYFMLHLKKIREEKSSLNFIFISTLLILKFGKNLLYLELNMNS